MFTVSPLHPEAVYRVRILYQSGSHRGAIRLKKYNNVHGKQAVPSIDFKILQASTMSTTGNPSTKAKILRAAATLPVVTVCGLAAGFTAGILLVALMSPWAPATRDFIFYWATAQQLAHHANPYDAAAIATLERSAGLPVAYKAGFMRNPPWALPLIYPLGFLSARVGWILWYFLLLACLAASVYLLWILYGRPRNERYLLGLSFAPALVCIIYGQTSLLLLPGLVLFLRWQRTRPFLAGVALSLCALKPHLFLPFGVVLLVWIAFERAAKLAAGVLAGLAFSCLLTFLIDPSALTQYAQMARASGIENEPIPCVSYLLRAWISPQSIWLQYLPALLGCAWAMAYYWPRRRNWDWPANGGLLLLVSLVAAPYSWIYDHGMVLPALLQSAFLARSRNLLIALAFLSALVEVALICSLRYPPALSLWTIWAAPAWLAWCLAANAPPGFWAKARSVLLSIRFLRGREAAVGRGGESDALE